MGTGSIYHSLLLSLNVVNLAFGVRYTTPPQNVELPFHSVWNAPTAECRGRYGVDLDLGVFSIYQNKQQVFMGKNITIFYENRLGLYPRYIQGEPINGGVPQNASLEKHLRAAAEDIRTYIPDRNFEGLAVVDWESWRPIWERNWDSKQVYWEASRALVRAKHPDWSPAQVNVVARKQFEKAGREFMEETLKLGQRSRPLGLWGYYGFPSCYNYLGKNKNQEYTGKCAPAEMKWNDELFWLWNISSALYPDIYLSLQMRGLGKDVLLYTHNRIAEAIRVGEQATPSAPPVFPYSRIVYTYTLDFLSKEHLIYTIGESAAMGSAGIVLWGDHSMAKSQASCEAVKAFIDETLGHYLVNVTSAATLCSQTLCSSRGRCQRKEPVSSAYLHLDAADWTVVAEPQPGGRRNYMVLGQMRSRQVNNMKAQFQCKCFPGWGGESCARPLSG